MSQTATSSLPPEAGELTELRAQVRRLLGRHWTVEQRRAFAGGDVTQSVGAVELLEGDIGVNGLLVPEELGGSGAGCAEVVAVAEELGAALAPSGILGSSMATYAALQAADLGVSELLKASTRRDARSAFLWPGADARWVGPPPAQVIEGRLDGDVSQVPDVESDSVLVVPAKKGETTGLAWLGGGGGEARVSITAYPTPDVFRGLADVRIRDSPVEFFPVKAADKVWAGTVALGSLVLAAEMVGAGFECVESIVGYGQSRLQFGRPIVTFQAVKHRVTDALIELEAARALVYRAADRLPRPGAPPPGPEVIDLARMAKAAASDALRRAALECIQLHGAIGFTWDHPAHLYLKRWATSSCLYGQPEDLRRLVYESAVNEMPTIERGSSVI